MANYPKTMKALVACSKAVYRFKTTHSTPEYGDDNVMSKYGDLKAALIP
jgi:hypothetical protein